MSIKTFLLPDLGEGLPEAEIVSWHVSEGDRVTLDQPMCSVETAKAVVEVPCPYTGIIAKIHGAEGDIVKTHAPLVDFNLSGEVTESNPSVNPSNDPINAAIQRVTGYDTVMPLFRQEMEYMPSVWRITNAAKEIMEASA